VLPLLAEHGGRLERRLRSAESAGGGDDVEVHVVSFPTPEGFAAYRGDPRRAEHAHLLEASGARTELLEMQDVPTA
jgi:hypothetical protein